MMPLHAMNLSAPFAVNPIAVQPLETRTLLATLGAVGKGSVQAFAVEASHGGQLLNRAPHVLGEL